MCVNCKRPSRRVDREPVWECHEANFETGDGYIDECILTTKHRDRTHIMAAEQEGNSQSKQHSLNSRQFMTGLSKMMDSMKGEEGGKDDNPPFTNDAVEALRLCHEEFLHFVACELGHRNQNSKDDTTATITVEDIMDCLEGIGFAELKKDVLADLGRCGW